MCSPILPIHEKLADIQQQLANSNALVLQAEPGAGKSTVLPLTLLNAPWLKGKSIVMLEPRRVAARSIAHYLAGQLGEKVGQTIGYQVRNDRRSSAATRLEIVTEGILTRRLQQDPELAGVGLIIFDEFHERSLQADLSLMLALEVQQALRDDLKLLVMSATIDTDKIAQYLGNAAVIHCPGRAHPVAIEHLPAPDYRSLPTTLESAVASAIVRALDESPQGDLLVFLPGRREIERCIDAVGALPLAQTPELLPLYGGLSLEAQERVLTARGSSTTPSSRRVIFSTNIAETSLTIPGITGVVDSGLERRVHYDPGSDMTRLELVRISKASATQRAGRAGRLGPGQCWRLWPESVHRQLPDHQPEEILGSDLSSLVLELFSWGLTGYDKTPWLTPPPRAHYDAALDTLISLGLIQDDTQGDPVTGRASQSTLSLSPLAQHIASLGVHPRIGVMLLASRSQTGAADVADALQYAACHLAALLGERDIFVGDNSVDLELRFNALLEYGRDRKYAHRTFPLHRAAAADAMATTQQLMRRLKLSEKSVKSVLFHPIAVLLLLAYPDRIAKQRGNTLRYQLANGKGVTLPGGDSLTGSQWLIVTDWDGKQSDGRVFQALAVDATTALDFMRPRSTVSSDLQLSDDGQKISRRQQYRYQSLIIETGNPEPVRGDDLLPHLPDLFKARGLALLNWPENAMQWLARATWLGQHLAGFPQITEASLVATVDSWLLPYVTKIKGLQDLKRLPALELAQATLSYSDQQRLETEAPAHYQAPSGKSVAIRYDDHQGPTVAIQLQELFGELSSPLLAGGTVPLRFELLSPARRPIQTTSDLAGFWQGSYFEVAKEMRGRYPKHRWPEKPLEEKPGKSLKAKR